MQTLRLQIKNDHLEGRKGKKRKTIFNMLKGVQKRLLQ